MTHSQPPPQSDTRTKKNPPIATRNVGPVFGKLYKNERPDGKVSLTATFSRIWQTKDGEYRESYDFGGANLLRLEKVAGLIHEEEQATLAQIKAGAAHDSPAPGDG